MLAPQLLDNSIAAAGDPILAGIPDPIGPPGAVGVEGAVEEAVGRREGDLLLLVFAELEEV
jgi:hypothetical protein